MTIHPVTRPRVTPQRSLGATPPRARSRPATVPPPPGATITVEVAVTGPDALDTATLLAGRIRDLVDSANAAAGNIDVSASVGLHIGAGGRATRPTLSPVGGPGWSTSRPSESAVAPAGPGPLAPTGPVPLPAFVQPGSTSEPVASEPVVSRSVESGPVVSGPVVSEPLQIYPARRVALLDGVQLQLTRREFDLLLFLSEHAGRVFDRPQLLRLVWGHQVICGERTVDVHVRRLRSKLERTGPVISTVRGVGYRLDSAERVAVVHEQS